MEYLIVEFPEACEVLVDGNPVGSNMAKGATFRLLTVPPGRHVISLQGAGHEPNDQAIVVDGTSPINPLRVVFEKKR